MKTVRLCGTELAVLPVLERILTFELQASLAVGAGTSSAKVSRSALLISKMELFS